MNPTAPKCELPEDADERRQFDEAVKLCDGDRFSAMRMTLKVWAGMHDRGSFGKICAIMHNELLSAPASSVSEPVADSPRQTVEDMIDILLDHAHAGCTRYQVAESLHAAGYELRQASRSHAAPSGEVGELPEKLPVSVQVGGIRFGKGVDTRLVLESIKRHATYPELTTEQRKEFNEVMLGLHEIPAPSAQEKS